MSYMRGEVYAWADGNGILHLWVEDGRDGFEESGWAKGKSHPAGVGLPMDDWDELVVMRYEEMKRDRLVREARIRAVAKHAGNGGCEALEDRMGRERREG